LSPKDFASESPLLWHVDAEALTIDEPKLAFPEWRRDLVLDRRQFDRRPYGAQAVFHKMPSLHTESDRTVKTQSTTTGCCTLRVIWRVLSSSIAEENNGAGTVDVRGQSTHCLAQQPRTLERALAPVRSLVVDRRWVQTWNAVQGDGVESARSHKRVDNLERHGAVIRLRK
jgi:hypothetical protein